MTNKEFIDSFVAYLMTQDPQHVAITCANLVCDLDRFLHIDLLDKKEQQSLLERTTKNCQTFVNVCNSIKSDIEFVKRDEL